MAAGDSQPERLPSLVAACASSRIYLVSKTPKFGEQPALKSSC